MKKRTNAPWFKEDLTKCPFCNGPCDDTSIPEEGLDSFPCDSCKAKLAKADPAPACSKCWVCEEQTSGPNTGEFLCMGQPDSGYRITQHIKDPRVNGCRPDWCPALENQEPICNDCTWCPKPRRRYGLTFCEHPDAKGVAGTTENTGYVKGFQARSQPSWCPLLKPDLLAADLEAIKKQVSSWPERSPSEERLSSMKGQPLTAKDLEEAAELIQQQPFTGGRMPVYKTMSAVEATEHTFWTCNVCQKDYQHANWDPLNAEAKCPNCDSRLELKVIIK